MSYQVDTSVEKLLSQYAAYKEKNEQLAGIERQLALATIRGDKQVGELSKKRDDMRQQLQQLSDEMTFDSPYVWIQYKYEAYKNDAQPILTMQDLRVHCSVEGYICTKRFLFLNGWLRKMNKHVLSDREYYPDSLSLRELLSGDGILSLSKDDAFMKQWRAYEYYRKDGVVAKWENFSEETSS